jgi:hypothetical protein
MAQLFIPAVLHAQSFENAVIIDPVPPTVIFRISLDGVNFGTAGGIITGAGQAQIDGVALNACLIGNTVPPVTPPPSSFDPPVVYTFCNATQPYGRDFLNLNLKMIRANDYSFNIQVVLNGTPVNLTGGTLRMSCKWQATDPDDAEIFSVTTPANGIAFITPTSGTATVTVASDLTNTDAIPFHRIDPVYDIQYTDQAGHRFTVAYGTLTILPNISETSP